jgi:hypothetical protein
MRLVAMLAPDALALGACDDDNTQSLLVRAHEGVHMLGALDLPEEAAPAGWRVGNGRPPQWSA